MATLKERLAEIIPNLRKEIGELNAEHGDMVIDKVTVGQVYGGMRGICAMVCDTSSVDPEKGLIIRGYPIGEIAHRWPREIFYLLLTGEFPDAEGLQSLEQDLCRYAEVPSYVADVLRAMPHDSHPMAMLSAGVLSMQRESIFAKRYHQMKKTEYWEAIYEDCIRLVARVTGVAAFIYRLRFGKGDLIPPLPDMDWAGNYAHMLGIPDPTGEFANLLRLYLTLHSDHESGNVSANTCHVVGSALSDPYYAITAGWNGLAGPLHGLANQECLDFVLSLYRDHGNQVPTDEQIAEYCWKNLSSGQVIPGYGHAVLRAEDPRFTSLRQFGLRCCPQDPVFQIVDRIYNIVPDLLRKQGKAKNPWPNVDAGSGCLLYHFGLKEFDYYTVLFAVSRALGLSAQLILNRALGTPLTRPKSVTTEWMKQKVAEKVGEKVAVS